MHRKLLFQSLINTSQPRPTLPEDTVTDLRLDTMLSGRACEILCRPAAETDISLRQELISAAEHDTELTERFASMRETLGNIERLFSRLDTTESSDERNVLTVRIFLASDAFLKCGAALSGCTAALAKRFAEHCSALLESEEYSERIRSLAEVGRDSDTVYRCTASVSSAYLSLSGDGQSDIGSRLRSLASSLGIAAGNGAPSYVPLGEGMISTFALLEPEYYNACSAFAEKYAPELDRSVLEYIPELDFLLSVVALVTRLRGAGIPLCIPEFSDGDDISVDSAYDITLLQKQQGGIIPNDIRFTDSERIFYLTGANGGGKTTYLRTVGNLVLLALSGAPVPARSAALPRLTAVYTHFPRDERFGGGGRFSDEETRADCIADKAGDRSLVLLNETYSTTGEVKAKQYTTELARRLSRQRCYCIYVTHQLPEGTGIPVLGVVLAGDGESRTYKIRREDATSGSHALDILKKYRLDRHSLRERFGAK